MWFLCEILRCFTENNMPDIICSEYAWSECGRVCSFLPPSRTCAGASSRTKEWLEVRTLDFFHVERMESRRAQPMLSLSEFVYRNKLERLVPTVVSTGYGALMIYRVPFPVVQKTAIFFEMQLRLLHGFSIPFLVQAPYYLGLPLSFFYQSGMGGTAPFLTLVDVLGHVPALPLTKPSSFVASPLIGRVVTILGYTYEIRHFHFYVRLKRSARRPSLNIFAKPFAPAVSPPSSSPSSSSSSGRPKKILLRPSSHTTTSTTASSRENPSSCSSLIIGQPEEPTKGSSSPPSSSRISAGTGSTLDGRMITPCPQADDTLGFSTTFGHFCSNLKLLTQAGRPILTPYGVATVFSESDALAERGLFYSLELRHIGDLSTLPT